MRVQGRNGQYSKITKLTEIPRYLDWGGTGGKGWPDYTRLEETAKLLTRELQP